MGFDPSVRLEITTERSVMSLGRSWARDPTKRARAPGWGPRTLGPTWVGVPWGPPEIRTLVPPCKQASRTGPFSSPGQGAYPVSPVVRLLGTGARAIMGRNSRSGRSLKGVPWVF